MVCTGNTYCTMYMYVIFDTDIDECSENTDNCSQTCTNTDGNFTCGCYIGYLLDTDGTTCNGMYRDYYVYIIITSKNSKNILKALSNYLCIREVDS